MTNGRRRLLRRARRWKLETLTFIRLHPIREACLAYSRQVDRLQKRDPALHEGVGRVSELDQVQAMKMGYEWWRARGCEQMRKVVRIRKAGRQAYLRKWWSPTKRAAAR